MLIFAFFIYVLIYHPGIAVATQIIKPDYQIYEKMLDFGIFFNRALRVIFCLSVCLSLLPERLQRFGDHN